ncbi:MAG: 5'/3'-nucleotidase SurE [Spirochaetes bacterium]|jgi:5'-nucleotidase|nr:5'/3'-nucleotidase SurE [Spirochaetota bacterium]
MNILLTNDDGIHSEGITVLGDALSVKHGVYVIAPNTERSACSNAITVRNDLGVEMLSEGRYALDGFPADCVNVGLHGGIIPSIDLVISGINHGPNLGDDVYFSGTTAGARTAFIFGVSGIALSLDCIGSSDYFGAAAGFMAAYLDEYRMLAERGPLFLNINYPDLPDKRIAGVRYTTLGKRRYRDSYSITGSSGNVMHMRMTGRIESDELEGSDAVELRNGYISITPLHLDCTDHSFIRRFSGQGAHG